MTLRRAPLVAALLVLLTAPSPAAADDEWQLWPTVNAQGPVRHGWLWNTELQPRIQEDASELNRVILRLQGGRKVHDRVTVWFGYEHTWGVAGRDEKRVWQVAEVSGGRLGGFRVQHRVRLEERWIENAGGMVPRLRYRFRLSRSLGTDSPWSYNVGEELFLVFREVSGGPRSGFERSRTTAALSRAITDVASFEWSYGLQFENRRAPRENDFIHIVQLTLGLRF